MTRPDGDQLLTKNQRKRKNYKANLRRRKAEGAIVKNPAIPPSAPPIPASVGAVPQVLVVQRKKKKNKKKRKSVGGQENGSSAGSPHSTQARISSPQLPSPKQLDLQQPAQGTPSSVSKLKNKKNRRGRNGQTPRGARRVDKKWRRCMGLKGKLQKIRRWKLMEDNEFTDDEPGSSGMNFYNESESDEEGEEESSVESDDETMDEVDERGELTALGVISEWKSAQWLRFALDAAKLDRLPEFAQLDAVLRMHYQHSQHGPKARRIMERKKSIARELTDRMRKYMNYMLPGVAWTLEKVCMLLKHMCSAFEVGSTVNGCGGVNSDLDLCLYVIDRDGRIHQSDKDGAFKFLKTALRKLRNPAKFRDGSFITQAFPIKATVPIISLRLEMWEATEAVDVDISYNNTNSLYNSHLLHYLTRMEPRFAELAIAVKTWAREHDINSSICCSYPLVLMVVHFLQSAIVPPVLPNLVHLFPTRFSKSAKFADLQFDCPVPTVPEDLKAEAGDKNVQSTSDLFVQFFAYYARFNFRRYAVHVARGGRVVKESLDGKTAEHILVVVDPYTEQNAARCVRLDKFPLIKRAFRLTYQRLSTPKEYQKGVPLFDLALGRFQRT